MPHAIDPTKPPALAMPLAWQLPVEFSNAAISLARKAIHTYIQSLPEKAVRGNSASKSDNPPSNSVHP